MPSPFLFAQASVAGKMPALQLRTQAGSARAVSVVELTRLSLGPLVKLGDVDQDLAVGRKLDVSTIHGTRRRTFEVDAFAVVPAPMAGALELVLTGLPVGRASQVRAARIDHKQAIARAIHPDAEPLLPLGIDPEGVVRRIADLERRARFEKGARQKEAEECEEPRAQEGSDGDPGQ